MKQIDSKISDLALMFTDLEGSSEFYNRVGDEVAFKEIQAHFELVVAILKRHDGTLVKTMGDAIMATFENPGDAFNAALEIQNRNSLQRQTRAGANTLKIRIGLHFGACHTVCNTGNTDHFGKTVNLAARVQGLCKGGEIVMTDAMASHPDVARLLSARANQATCFAAAIKGFDEKLNLFRLSLTQRLSATRSVRKEMSALFGILGQVSMVIAMVAFSSCSRLTLIGALGSPVPAAYWFSGRTSTRTDLDAKCPSGMR